MRFYFYKNKNRHTIEAENVLEKLKINILFYNCTTFDKKNVDMVYYINCS